MIDPTTTTERFYARVVCNDLGGTVEVAVFDPDRYNGKGGPRHGFGAEALILSRPDHSDSEGRWILSAEAGQGSIGAIDPDLAALRVFVYGAAVTVAGFVNRRLAAGDDVVAVAERVAEVLSAAKSTPLGERVGEPMSAAYLAGALELLESGFTGEPGDTATATIRATYDPTDVGPLGGDAPGNEATARALWRDAFARIADDIAESQGCKVEVAFSDADPSRDGARRHLVVRYDVTGLTDQQVDALSGEAEAQGEDNKGDDEWWHPGVPVAVSVEVVEGRSA